MDAADQKKNRKGQGVSRATDAAVEEKPKQPREKGLSRRVIAMSHPLRARILRLLVERGEMSPTQMSRELKEPLGDVSYHVRQLEKLDCAELVRTRPVRGALEHFYRATERHLIDADEWDQLDPIIGDDLVCGFVQSILDDFVASKKAGIVGSDRYFHITRTPLVLDEEGLDESLEIFERSRLEMVEVERRSGERRAEADKPGFPVSSSLVLFKMPLRDHLGPA